MELIGPPSWPLWEVGAWMALLLLHHTSVGQSDEPAAWNATCPQPCTCVLRRSEYTNDSGSLLQTADCSKKKLRSVPMDVPINTETLLLQGNAIRSLHEHLPPLSLLQEMDLSVNQITSLGTYHIFQNLTSLRRLNMANNGLETLLHGSFSGLDSLQHFELGHNQIDLIEDSAFGDLSHLRVLSLQANKISQLQGKWFENLPYLESLSLAENQLEGVEGPVFRELISLKVLSLRGNKLSRLSYHAFDGLDNLSKLDLSHNALTRVPSDPLKVFASLTVLTLDENPIRLISKRDFQIFSVKEIQLRRMRELIAVDAAAFYDLNNLETLRLHDNPNLSYMDPGAFVQTNSLSMLYVHNNKLKAIPYTLPLVLPVLRELTVYGNPIQCDCNVHWIKELTDSNSTLTLHNDSSIVFPDIDKVKCGTPEDLRGKSYASVQLSGLASNCSPTVIRFFNDSEYLELSESITFECRGIGVPAPHIHWILPNGKVLNGTSNISRIRMETMGTLSIDHLKASDAGKYTCVATNFVGDKGFDIAHSALRIHNKYIHVIVKGVATNFVTVTWNGTGDTIATSDYLLIYRQVGVERDFHKISIRPYMRSYTITNLMPHTLYEFCMAFVHGKNFQKLNCLNVQTKHQMFVMTGIRTMGNLSILIAIVISISFICFLCAATMVIRRYKKRKAYKQTEGANVPQKVGSLSQIPLDNIYHPPSTPLCTSRTSLIGQPSSSA